MPRNNRAKVAPLTTIDIKLPVDPQYVVIMCAGVGKRWDYNIPKPLAEIGGKSNILRTIGMLQKFGISNDSITVTVNHNNINMFPKDLPLLSVPVSNREIDRFRNAFPIISATTSKRIVFLYGDVVYDLNDMYAILTTKDSTFFGNKAGNAKTNKKWGEIYGLAICNIRLFIDHVNEVAYRFETNQIGREIGWDVYNANKNIYKFVNLSHKTDDYDTIAEYRIIKDLYATED